MAFVRWRTAVKVLCCVSIFIVYWMMGLQIIMVGLDNAGKTTILYKLHIGESFTTYPTIGSNVEQVQRKNFRMQVCKKVDLISCAKLANGS